MTRFDKNERDFCSFYIFLTQMNKIDNKNNKTQKAIIRIDSNQIENIT